MGAKAKTINLLLYDGSLHGVISVEDSGWNSGELYSAPRDSVESLLATDACNRYGVYLLLSSDKVYIGQSTDLARRLTQHLSGRDWWTSVIVLTTKDDSLNHADIDYLESMLIERAQAVGRLDCDNANKGNPRKVGKFREVFLSQYLEEALFLLQFIGITVFVPEQAPTHDNLAKTGTLIVDTTDPRVRLKLGTRAKGDAIRYLKEQGIGLSAATSYSKLQSNGEEFWLNPQAELLKADWSIILNDTTAGRLIVLSVPAGSLSLAQAGRPGLSPRSDKPDLIDLHIRLDSLTDRASGIDFSPFLSATLPY